MMMRIEVDVRTGSITEHPDAPPSGLDEPLPSGPTEVEKLREELNDLKAALVTKQVLTTAEMKGAKAARQ